MLQGISKEQVDLISQNIEQEMEKRSRNLSNDGILDFELYSKAPLRILWVLKQEVGGYFVSPEKEGRAWKDYYPKGIKHDMQNGKLLSSKTWGKMAAASYMLINGCDKYEDSITAGDEACGQSFLSTAIVEVNKEPGGSETSLNELMTGYKEYGEILRWQLDAYRPDIVICCFGERARKIVADVKMQLSNRQNDWNADWNWQQCGKHCDFSDCDGSILMWVYHPQYLGQGAKEYCEEIVGAYKLWRASKQ